MATDIKARFDKALNYIKSPPAGAPAVEMDNQQKLDFYAMFKQATEGQCKGKRPGITKMVERAKYDAWKKLGKMTKEDAMKKYCAELTKIAKTWEQPAPKL